MKLWHLTLLRNVDWDMSNGFIVRAESEEQARQIAFDNEEISWGEENVWKDSKQSLCRDLKADGKAEMIIRDYNAS